MGNRGTGSGCSSWCGAKGREGAMLGKPPQPTHYSPHTEGLWVRHMGSGDNDGRWKCSIMGLAGPTAPHHPKHPPWGSQGWWGHQYTHPRASPAFQALAQSMNRRCWVSSGWRRGQGRFARLMVAPTTPCCCANTRCLLFPTTRAGENPGWREGRQVAGRAVLPAQGSWVGGRQGCCRPSAHPQAEAVD